ncbi:MAG: glutathione S-transferase [Pseudomonadota bacterium]
MAISFSDLVRRANDDLTAPEQHRIVGAADSEPPRFEVYHAPFSVCSHKVRFILLERRIPFVSHEVRMNLVDHKAPPPDNYKPGYVRLRLQGALDARFVSSYTGQSSVSTEGFDPCVVPTLADHRRERVVVDSARICAYLDREAVDGPRLIPDALADAVEEQIALIDKAPHVAVLYGAHPDGDDRPEMLAAGLRGVHDRKIKHLEALIVSANGDDHLIAAYKAKIAKEASAKSFVYEPSAMIEAHQRMKAHVAALEKQLSTHNGHWALGDDYTMADIMWTVSLFRLKWLGLGGLWEDSNSAARVAAYVMGAFARPSFQDAIVNWPRSTPPTPHIEETAAYAQRVHKAWREMAARAAQ